MSFFLPKEINLFAIKEFIFDVGEREKEKNMHTHTKHTISKADLSPFVKPDLNNVCNIHVYKYENAECLLKT